jgi:hypothetical protein
MKDQKAEGGPHARIDSRRAGKTMKTPSAKRHRDHGAHPEISMICAPENIEMCFYGG